MAENLRVLHFNDCANVGLFLVRAAARAGYHWDYLPPDKVRPAHTPQGIGRVRWLPYFMRRWHLMNRNTIVHVHYATSVPLIHQHPLPKRPYFLHLHGSDIRRRWKEPQWHDLVQHAIDGAQKVYYTNLDTVEEATAARADAQYMPAFVEPELLPAWRGGQPGRDIRQRRVVFVSRWDEDKGVARQLQLVARLRQAFPALSLEGLDWGPGAPEAARLGVKLHPKMPHSKFLDWLAGADLAIGQANRILAISEFEAMYIGLPLAALGSRLPRLDDHSTPPALEGTLEDVVEAIAAALENPQETATDLGGHQWVVAHHLADAYIPGLLADYRRALHQ